MPRLAVLVSTTTLLVGPTVLAFFAGGYFDGPRATAAAIAWALVLLLAVAGPAVSYTHLTLPTTPYV